jgi:hypothetical protein
MTANSQRRPGNRQRAKPNATKLHDSTVPVVASVVMTTEFQR